jgi:hypothetical protein
MTTIYELNEKATPGPYSYRYQSAAAARAEAKAEGYNSDGGGSTGHILCGKGDGFGPNVMAHMAINRDVRLDAQRHADTALLAHCRNHFLEALEALVSIADESERAYLGGYDMKALIKKLETVEVA